MYIKNMQVHVTIYTGYEGGDDNDTTIYNNTLNQIIWLRDRNAVVSRSTTGIGDKITITLPQGRLIGIVKSHQVREVSGMWNIQLSDADWVGDYHVFDDGIFYCGYWELKNKYTSKITLESIKPYNLTGELSYSTYERVYSLCSTEPNSSNLLTAVLTNLIRNRRDYS